jgi:curved DNA-binding protein CbpA
MPTIYELLGVGPDADTGTIQHAYRRLVREVHPDAVVDRLPMEQAAAAERFRLLTDAWSIARDPHLRGEYDALLSSAPQGFREGSARPSRPPGPGECRFWGSSPACEGTLRQETGMVSDGQTALIDRSLLSKLRHCDVSRDYE